MSTLRYWLWLTATRHIGIGGISALLDEFSSPEEIYAAPPESIKASVKLSDFAIAELGDKSFDRAERIMEDCERLGISVITIQDSLYPARLRGIASPPAVLYYKGKLPVFDEEPAIAMVGSRSFTPYGEYAAREFAYNLSKAGVYVISGLAKGIDAASHVGALQAGGGTAAVLGCGVDVIYPYENRQLYEDIAYRGALISELPPTTPVMGSNFPQRNRLMSGLSLGVLVVEAPARSGALITANHALEQGRDLFAVPGNIGRPESAGSNNLIKNGAMLVTAAEDIIAEYRPLFQSKLKQWGAQKTPPPPPQSSSSAKAKEKAKVKEKEAKDTPKPVDLTPVLEGRSDLQQRLILYMVSGEKHMDELIAYSGDSPQNVMGEVTELELLGVCEQLPGKYFRLVVFQGRQ